MVNAKAAALAFVKGWRVEDLANLAEEIFDELMAERIWSGTHALAQLHLAAGQRVWLVTAAPIELGRVIAERLGLTGALGTVAEIRDGVYTGRLVGDLLHGPAKAEAITELADAEGLDLARCTAYSDSINDVPMLSTVGHAVAVNPDAGCAARPAGGAGRYATSVPAARPPRSPSRRRSASGWSSAPPSPPPPCAAAPAPAGSDAVNGRRVVRGGRSRRRPGPGAARGGSAGSSRGPGRPG